MENLVKLVTEKFKNINNYNLLNFIEEIKNYNSNDWQKYKSKFPIQNNKNYIKQTIFLNKNFELILIKWDKNSQSSIHHHPENGCILKVLDGKLLEKRYYNNKICKNTIFNNNEIGYMHDNLGTHKIYALEETYSLHLYSPPNFYT